MDRTAFYDALRPHVNLTTQNVAGMERVLTYGEEHNVQINHFAYAIATAWWETAQTMHPIREYGSEKYLRSKKYWPYVGMGLIQVTWEENYRKAARLLGLPEGTFVLAPSLLLDWGHALPLLFKGMETGLYTGKKLDDYIDDIDEPDDEDLREYVNARRIVNGTDKATAIGTLALRFEAALKAAGYGQDVDQVPAEPDPDPPVDEPVSPVPWSMWGPWGLWPHAVAGILALLAIAAFLYLTGDTP